jgi:hypothetical protein
MPDDETITSYADRLVELSEKVIREGGGERAVQRGRPVYRISTESPGNVHPLRRAENESEKLTAELRKEILAGIQDSTDEQKRARAAYLAICLDMAPALAKEHSAEWRKAVAALNEYQPLVEYLFSAQPGTLAHAQFKQRATSAGIVSRKK